jgi:replicative DNA helicase
VVALPEGGRGPSAAAATDPAGRDRVACSQQENAPVRAERVYFWTRVYCWTGADRRFCVDRGVPVPRDERGLIVPQANYAIAADIFDGWKDDVLTGSPPTLFRVGAGELGRIEVGPGLVTLLGGAPGAGKTAFTMQLVTDGLRLTPALRSLVCNVEMSPRVLLDRQLARLSGIDLRTIRYRRFDKEHAERIDQAMHTLEPLADRLTFLRPPFNLENVAASADASRADLLLLDYIQRIPPPGADRHADKRAAVNATMDYLRQFADAGVAVFVVAAVGRTKDAKGRSSYVGDGLNLASFRESSELEFGADDAFILVPEEGRDGGTVAVTLKHLKARHTEPKDLVLKFDRRIQRFSEAAAGAGKLGDEKPGKLQSALAALWDQTSPADDDADQEGKA